MWVLNFYIHISSLEIFTWYIFFKKNFSRWQSLSGQEQQSLYRINSHGIFRCCGSTGFLNRDSHVCKMLGFNLSTQSIQYSLVQCIQCRKNFNGPIGMKYHCNRVHFGQLMIICPLCDLLLLQVMLTTFICLPPMGVWRNLMRGL